MATADNPEELERRIRFELDCLGQTNGHHAFEQLCLGIARRRITTNLMPATGPVSSGGDQARDAESYWSNIGVELPGTSLFASRVSTERVVMACTIQRRGLAAKVRSDVTALGGQGGVDRVIYFITGPLPVARRHVLQAEALAKHQIQLDIWDINAVSSELKEPDLFYLAVTHLHLPASLAPERDEPASGLPDWYVDDRQRWRHREQPPATIGDLIDLTPSLRYSVEHASARADLPEWTALVRELAASAPSGSLLARSRYELVVAAISGMGNLRHEDHTLRAYFADLAPVSEDVGILEDAVLLIEFACGAWLRAATSISRAEIDGWRDWMRAHVARLLAAHPYPNAEAGLLAVAARLELQPNYPDDLTPQPGSLPSTADVSERIRAAVDAGETIHHTAPTDLTFIDLDAGMSLLQQLVRRLERAPFFPIENTVQHFNFCVAALVGHPLYNEVRDGLDAAVERIEGESARGERAQSRAVSLLEADLTLDALREVHSAKINWWHGDTVEGAAIMCLLASRIYADLGLPLAAKQYALTASAIAQRAPSNEFGVLVARGFVLAASYEHQAGMWLSATHTFRVGLLAQNVYADDPLNGERYPYAMSMLINQALIVRAARTVRPEYLTVIDAVLDRLAGLREVIDGLLAPAAQLPAMTDLEYGEVADRDGLGRPFSDAGRARRYTWTALGTIWDVRCANDRIDVLATERFVAALQILSAELASADALLMTGRIKIEVVADRSDLQPDVDPCERLPNNQASTWRIHLTSGSGLNGDEAFDEVAATVVTVVLDRSLLSPSAFMTIIERSFEHGLWHKLFTGRPYDEAADFLGSTAYEQMAALTTPAPGEELERNPLTKSRALGAIAASAPDYDEDRSLAAVTARYDNILPMVRHTLGHLISHRPFLEVVRRLRGEGWLDWHLLTAVANLAGNERLARSGIRLHIGMTQRDADHAQSVMKQLERDASDAISVELFTEQRLRASLAMAVLSTLGNLGLSNNQHTPDFAAIFRFLGDRYNYWTDDVPHATIFPTLD